MAHVSKSKTISYNRVLKHTLLIRVEISIGKTTSVTKRGLTDLYQWPNPMA